MALLDDDARKVLVGVAIGLGVSSLLHEIAPIFRGVARPLAKASIKKGLTTFERGRVAVARWSEVLEDLIAESKAELEMEAHTGTATTPTPGASTPGAT